MENSVVPDRSRYREGRELGIIGRNRLLPIRSLAAVAVATGWSANQLNSMTDTIDQPNREETTSIPGMLLHCGARAVTEAELFAVATPRATDTWFPLAHRNLLTEVREQLTSAEFEINSTVHALSHDGARYFGILQVRLPYHHASDYGWIVGLRNSHDKSYPAGLVAGTRVFVCDNLVFSGEVKLSRKHTRHAVRDLNHLTARAVGKLGDKFQLLDERISAYREKSIGNPAAHDLIVRAVDCKAIVPSQIRHVLREWRKPRFPEFEPRNAWSLFNAFTEVHKRVNPHAAIKRGEALHGLFDVAAGVN